MQKIRPDLDLGKNIQMLRRAKKYTQNDVIAKLQLLGISISKSTYAKIETNRMNIKVSELIALKDIFEVSFDDFFVDLT
jgi:transcriptional regulator with XRE-family HTH domain